MNQSDERLPSLTRETLWDLLGRSAVYRQYLAHLGRGRVGAEPRNTQPWQAEGERQYAAFLLSSVGTPVGATMLTESAGDISEDWATVCIGAAFQAMAASVYLWFQEIEDLADATPLPKHVVSPSVMSATVMFWSRDVARDAGIGENNWLLLRHTPDGIEMFGDTTVGKNDIRIGGGLIVRYGQTYPDDISDNNIDWARRILSRLAFLNSPYVSAEDAKLPRAWRRAALRNATTAPLADPTIRVVRLRRDARESIDRHRQDIEHPTERRSHWWVSGHCRAQWYPSKSAHEVIWIAPYLKGDLSKPLARKVYAVTR